MLPKIKESLLQSFLAGIENGETLNNESLMREMFESQPVLKDLVISVIEDDSLSIDKKDGYCKGIVQAWYLLNTQYIINEVL